MFAPSFSRRRKRDAWAGRRKVPSDSARWDHYSFVAAVAETAAAALTTAAAAGSRL